MSQKRTSYYGATVTLLLAAGALTIPLEHANMAGKAGGPDVKTLSEQIPRSVAIASGPLAASVALPDFETGFYRGTRFDHGGMVVSLIAGGQEYYGRWFDGVDATVRDYAYRGGTVIAGPNTAAAGPAETFDATDPPGWNEAAPGSGFLKIGVGILRKPVDAARYVSFLTYPVIDGGRWSVQKGRGWVTMTHRLRDPATGFGYVYTKTIMLEGARREMRIVHRLRNIGTRLIATTMYNHNFVTFGGTPTDTGTRLILPFPIVTAKPLASDAAAAIDGATLTYRRPLRDGEVLSIPLDLPATQPKGGAIRLAAASGAAVTMVSDHPLAKLAFWSISRTVAVEPFVTVAAAPGKSARWSFTYRYDPRR